MIEIMRFRLRANAEVDDFVAADKILQAGFAYQQPGLLRRTTARGDSGQWIVIDLWATPEDADRCAQRWDADPLVREFMGFVDPGTVESERYADLGG